MGRINLRLGVFGGTFDPPHIGHLILAAEAENQLNLDLIYWVLTPHPPHKQERGISSVEQRLLLLAACINGHETFVVSKVDMDRQPPHYAVETLQILRKEHPKDKLIYLMGADSLEDLPNWHNPSGFVEANDEIGVMCRPDSNVDLSEIEAEIPGVSEKVQFIEAPLLEISSSEIRRRIMGNRPYRYYLPGRVYSLIVNHKMYR